VQPVTVSGDVALPHDITAHVVFNYIQRDAAAASRAKQGGLCAIVQDLRALKKSLPYRRSLVACRCRCIRAFPQTQNR